MFEQVFEMSRFDRRFRGDRRLRIGVQGGWVARPGVGAASAAVVAGPAGLGIVAGLPWPGGEPWPSEEQLAELDEALALVDRLPATLAAWAGGHLDGPRVRVITRGTTQPSDDHARAVDTVLAGAGPPLTTGQLRAVVEREVLAVDPVAGRDATLPLIPGAQAQARRCATARHPRVPAPSTSVLTRTNDGATPLPVRARSAIPPATAPAQAPVPVRQDVGRRTPSVASQPRPAPTANGQATPRTSSAAASSPCDRRPTAAKASTTARSAAAEAATLRDPTAPIGRVMAATLRPLQPAAPPPRHVGAGNVGSPAWAFTG